MVVGFALAIFFGQLGQCKASITWTSLTIALLYMTYHNPGDYTLYLAMNIVYSAWFPLARMSKVTQLIMFGAQTYIGYRCGHYLVSNALTHMWMTRAITLYSIVNLVLPNFGYSPLP